MLPSSLSDGHFCKQVQTTTKAYPAQNIESAEIEETWPGIFLKYKGKGKLLRESELYILDHDPFQRWEWCSNPERGTQSRISEEMKHLFLWVAYLIKKHKCVNLSMTLNHENLFISSYKSSYLLFLILRCCKIRTWHHRTPGNLFFPFLIVHKLMVKDGLELVKVYPLLLLLFILLIEHSI